LQIAQVAEKLIVTALYERRLSAARATAGAKGSAEFFSNLRRLRSFEKVTKGKRWSSPTKKGELIQKLCSGLLK
jgi:hypothetical protein